MTPPVPPVDPVERAARARAVLGLLVIAVAVCAGRYLAPLWVAFVALPLAVAGGYVIGSAAYLVGFRDGRDDRGHRG